MAIEFTQSVTSAGESSWIRVDSTGRAGSNFLIVADLEVDGGSKVSVEFAVQKTLDADTVAIEHHILKDLTKSLASTLHVPATAFRLNVKTMGSGTINMRVVQHED